MNRGIPSYLIRKACAEDEEINQIIEEPSPVGLPPALERQRRGAIAHLGERWLLHPVHAPKKGTYNYYGMKID